jgi:hypothetical protein
MSNTNETHDQGSLDHNLNRLLELGEPAPGMPEDLKIRIRSKLTEAGRGSMKKRILPSRWAVWPVAATIMAAVVLIVLWYGNSSKAIAGADVQGRLNQVHTMTLSRITKISEPTGMRITGRYKLYYKDPGLSRSEGYPTNAGPGSVEEEPQRITISRNKPGSSEGVTLYPGAHRAELFDTAFLTDGPQPLLQPPMDVASLNWESIKEIMADKTRSIGDRMINGVAAVGFEFEQPAKWYFDAVEKAKRNYGRVIATVASCL